MVLTLRFHHAKKFINLTKLKRSIHFSNQFNKNGHVKLNEEWKKLSVAFMKGKTVDSLVWQTDEVSFYSDSFKKIVLYICIYNQL